MRITSKQTFTTDVKNRIVQVGDSYPSRGQLRSCQFSYKKKSNPSIFNKGGTTKEQKEQKP
jgi:hypothetical protein